MQQILGSAIPYQSPPFPQYTVFASLNITLLAGCLSLVSESQILPDWRQCLLLAGALPGSTVVLCNICPWIRNQGQGSSKQFEFLYLLLTTVLCKCPNCYASFSLERFVSCRCESTPKRAPLFWQACCSKRRWSGEAYFCLF